MATDDARKRPSWLGWSWVLLLMGVPTLQSRADADVPVVRANSPIVDVREGGRLQKGGWEITPGLPLDIYSPRRGTEPATVVFITDVESRSFVVRPGEMVDFIFLLNGRDECRTRIWMKERPAQRAEGTPPGPVEMPLKFIRGKPHVQGRINDSEPLWLLFDTGAATTLVYPSALGKGLALEFDGATLSAGSGGVVNRKTSSDVRISIAGLRWDHESAIYVEKQTDGGDGIIGVNIFEGKVVELDYDRMVMRVHDSLPEEATSYDGLPIVYAGTLLTVPGTVRFGPTRATVPMVFNTGGSGALMGNALVLEPDGVRVERRVIGRTNVGGIGLRQAKADVILVPEFQIAGHELRDVPMVVPDRDGQADVPGVDDPAARGMLCLDVLGRFNTLLDLRDDRVYLKPNSQFRAPFRRRVAGVPQEVVAVLVAGSVVALLGMVVAARRRRPPRPSAA